MATLLQPGERSPALSIVHGQQLYAQSNGWTSNGATFLGSGFTIFSGTSLNLDYVTVPIGTYTLMGVAGVVDTPSAVTLHLSLTPSVSTDDLYPQRQEKDEPSVSAIKWIAGTITVVSTTSVYLNVTCFSGSGNYVQGALMAAQIG